MTTHKREPYNPLLKSYPDSEKVNAVSIGAETLYTRLLAQSDDAAHYYADPGMILAKLYTLRMCAGQVDAKTVAGWIEELNREGLVEEYEAGGKRYLELVGCFKKLRNDVKLDVRFPSRPSNVSGPYPARIRDESGPLTQPNPTQPNPLSRPVPDVPAAPAVVPGSAPSGAAVTAARQSAASAEPVGFARWWAEYPPGPRKKGKSKCLRIWSRKGLERDADRVIAALRCCKASHDWRKQAGRFIPGPEPWLNDGPWETSLADLAGGASAANEDIDPDTFVGKATPEMIALICGGNGEGGES